MALHAEVERSGLMQELLRGKLPRAGYCALLRNLHAIYRELEDALARRALDPRIAPLLLPGLERAGRLARDLETLHGPGWQEELALAPAARRYRRRLRELDQRAPLRLLAHAYVRYLGDLNGGQVLLRIVSRNLGLGSGEGTAFYDFGPVQTTAALAQKFREGLDAVPVDADEREDLAREARLGFLLHRRLFAELAASGVPA